MSIVSKSHGDKVGDIEYDSILNHMDILKGLNDRQQQAVLHQNGPLLILAGAGAGKTKTLTHRILNLVRSGVSPREILAITFTNKAAKEMRERVMHLLQTPGAVSTPISFTEKPFVSTFHSLGVHIIKENSHLLGLNRSFTIIDKNDGLKMVKEALAEEGLDPKKFEPSKILRIISREKGNMMTLEKYREIVGKEFISGIVLRIWSRYEAALRKEQSLDFDDLLLKAALLLKEHPQVLARYQDTWKYVHVDEYQDTNKVQYLITKLLAEKYRNLCVVGDADQNIYSWRGADIRNILDFEKDYPEAQVILLEENYRSTKTIIEAANQIIKKNKNRKEKNLFTNNETGEKISLFQSLDENEEARYIAETAKEIIKRGIHPNEVAVLYRANFQSRVLEEAFLRAEVAYQMLGTRFFERKEVKDCLSYIRAAINPASLSDIKRIINEPVRGIGKVTMLKVIEGKEHELSGAAQEKVFSFKRILSNIADLAKREQASSVVKFTIKESGLEAALKDGTEEGLERLENLQELVTLATKYDEFDGTQGIEKLLEDASLASDQDEMDKPKEGVKLMTVHASKGLEFQHVFVCGLEDELFPHKSMNESAENDDREEEERRLFYVALTRARKKLHLSYANIRTIFGSKKINAPSEFLTDIDDVFLEAVEYERDPWKNNKEKVIYFD